MCIYSKSPRVSCSDNKVFKFAFSHLQSSCSEAQALKSDDCEGESRTTDSQAHAEMVFAFTQLLIEDLLSAYHVPGTVPGSLGRIRSTRDKSSTFKVYNLMRTH